MPCEQIRALIGCAICLVVIGPILLIVGIVMLLGPNTRAEDVEKYNAAVTEFDKSERNFISQMTGSANLGSSVATLGVLTQRVSISGNMDDVTPNGTSVYLTGQTTPFSGTSSVFSVNINSPGTESTFVDTDMGTVPLTTTTTVNVRCANDQRCDRDCSDSDDRRCTSSRLSSYCRSRYGSSASYSGKNNCYGTSSCGECRYSGSLDSACKVMKFSNGWVEDTSKSACKYPFRSTSQEYSSRSSATGQNIRLSVRSNKDPYIVLEEITEGKRDFGLTEAQQRSIGLTLIIIGALLTAAVIVPAVMYCRNRDQQQQQQQQMATADGQVMQPQPGYPQQQQQPDQYPPQQQPQPQGQYPPPQQQPGGYPPQQQQPGGYPPQQQGYPPQQQQQPGGYPPQGQQPPPKEQPDPLYNSSNV